LKKVVQEAKTCYNNLLKNLLMMLKQYGILFKPVLGKIRYQTKFVK